VFVPHCLFLKFIDLLIKCEILSKVELHMLKMYMLKKHEDKNNNKNSHHVPGSDPPGKLFNASVSPSK
jgi:hypothetical protein